MPSKIETEFHEENGDMNLGTVHPSYWIARHESGILGYGVTESEALENVKGQLEAFEVQFNQ